MEQILGHSLLPTFVSTLVGSLVTWVCAWLYYKRAGDELRAEAKALHASTSAIVYFLEHPDAQIQAQRDADGRVTGLVVNISAHGSIKFSGKGTLTDAG